MWITNKEEHCSKERNSEEITDEKQEETVFLMRETRVKITRNKAKVDPHNAKECKEENE